MRIVSVDILALGPSSMSMAPPSDLKCASKTGKVKQAGFSCRLGFLMHPRRGTAEALDGGPWTVVRFNLY